MLKKTLFIILFYGILFLFLTNFLDKYKFDLVKKYNKTVNKITVDKLKFYENDINGQYSLIFKNKPYVKYIENQYFHTLKFLRQYNIEPQHTDYKDFLYKKMYLNLYYTYYLNNTNVLNEYFQSSVPKFYYRNKNLDQLIKIVESNVNIISYYDKCYFEPKIIFNIIYIESNFSSDIISKNNAIGIMQIKPLVLTEYKRIKNHEFNYKNFFNVSDNIYLGTWLLCHYYKKNNYNIDKTLIAYNRGINKLKKMSKKQIRNDKYVYKFYNNSVFKNPTKSINNFLSIR